MRQGRFYVWHANPFWRAGPAFIVSHQADRYAGAVLCERPALHRDFHARRDKVSDSPVAFLPAPIMGKCRRHDRNAPAAGREARKGRTKMPGTGMSVASPLLAAGERWVDKHDIWPHACWQKVVDELSIVTADLGTKRLPKQSGSHGIAFVQEKARARQLRKNGQQPGTSRRFKDLVVSPDRGSPSGEISQWQGCRELLHVDLTLRSDRLGWQAFGSRQQVNKDGFGQRLVQRIAHKCQGLSRLQRVECLAQRPGARRVASAEIGGHQAGETVSVDGLAAHYEFAEVFRDRSEGPDFLIVRPGASGNGGKEIRGHGKLQMPAAKRLQARSSGP
ncbi:MAG TPA: hypothetical protein VMR39_06815 [Sphingobium sp.]|nr:hypothetical protein [Sphingobium sp.]HUD91281.1 hypothetical protein [Sphingobium sp.]